MIELHVIFQGVVQGVGFRRHVLRCALQHKVVGSVRNLESGHVEMIAQGSQEQLEALLTTICENSGSARVEAAETMWRSIQKNYQQFDILQ